MKKRMFYFLFISCIAFFIAGCSSDDTNDTDSTDSIADTTGTDKTIGADTARLSETDRANAEKTDKTEAFKAFYSNILDLFAAKKYDAIGKYIHPEIGVFKMHAPGVATFAQHSKTFDASFLGTHARNLQFDCEVKFESVPEFDCENEWSKEGCFCDEITGYNELTTNISFEEDMTGIKPSPEKIAKAKKAEKIIERVLVVTENFSKFYFAWSDNKWYLIACDFVVPCST